jgi:hypothetical protein
VTRRVKQARDEAWSFVHRQVRGLVAVDGARRAEYFRDVLFGGGYMVCTLWLVVPASPLPARLFSENCSNGSASR